MRFDMLYAKLHRARVSAADINYIGSITIDRELCEEVGLLEGMKVDVVNTNNGARLSTYVLFGERGSGVVCLNGAAARCACVGDIIIIIAYASMEEQEARAHRPRVAFLDGNNHIQRS